jgi:AraC-like DNA-binding protein
MSDSVKAAMDPKQELPANWLKPALHSVYLQAMINFAERHDYSQGTRGQYLELRPGMHSYLYTYNLLKELHYSPDPLVGMEFGLLVPPAAHGAMGQAAVTSFDIGQAIALIAEYTPMRNDLVQYSWREEQDNGTLTMTPSFEMGEFSDFILAATTTTFFQMILFLMGPRAASGIVMETPWRFDRRALSQLNIAGTVELRYARGVDHSALVLPVEALRYRNATRDARQNRFACESCRSELALLHGSIAARVKTYLQGKDCRSWPVLNAMASQLSMSRRTLIRKLEREGTSYQALVDEIKGNLACWKLENTEQSIGDLSYLLGYDDESNFSRKFRRWRGMTPSQYRKFLASNREGA